MLGVVDKLFVLFALMSPPLYLIFHRILGRGDRGHQDNHLILKIKTLSSREDVNFPRQRYNVTLGPK